jgi:hypothetical protein
MWTVILVPTVLAALVALVLLVTAHQVRHSGERTLEQDQNDALARPGRDEWNPGL